MTGNRVDLTKTNWRDTITNPDARRLLEANERACAALRDAAAATSVLSFTIGGWIIGGTWSEAAGTAVILAPVWLAFRWVVLRFRERQAQDIINERLGR